MKLADMKQIPALFWTVASTVFVIAGAFGVFLWFFRPDVQDNYSILVVSGFALLAGFAMVYAMAVDARKGPRSILLVMGLSGLFAVKHTAADHFTAERMLGAKRKAGDRLSEVARDLVFVDLRIKSNDEAGKYKPEVRQALKFKRIPARDAVERLRDQFEKTGQINDAAFRWAKQKIDSYETEAIHAVERSSRPIGP